MPESGAEIAWLAAKWVLPVVVFFIAARPYTTRNGRIATAALGWGVIAGILGPVLEGQGVLMIPLAFILGALHMGVGMAILEYALGRNEVGA